MLITVNFLNSDFILNEEVPRLLERRHKNEGMAVLPVIAKSCAWQSVPWLTQLNVRPRNANPVWRQQGIHADEDLATIASEVANILRNHKPRSTPTPNELTNTTRGYQPNLIKPPLDDTRPVKPAIGVREVPGNDRREKRQVDYQRWISRAFVWEILEPLDGEIFGLLGKGMVGVLVGGVVGALLVGGIGGICLGGVLAGSGRCTTCRRTWCRDWRGA